MLQEDTLSTATPLRFLSTMTLEELAPLPATVTRLLPLLDNPEVSLHRLAVVLAHEIGLSATVLRVANSAVYGMSQQVGTVYKALHIIGLKQARLLVITGGVAQAARSGLPIYGLGPGDLLKHSELVA